jgi:uncharacterized repeat protein (TIGR03806 family)
MGLVVLLALPVHRALAADSGAAAKRTLWQNTRLMGSPEPAAPYAVEKTFTHIEWKSPIYLAPEPGTEKLWVVLQGGEKERPSRVLRIDDKPETEQTELLLEMKGRLIYAVTFHPGYRANGFIYVFSNGPTGATERVNRISRFSVSRPAPFACDPASEQVIIEWRSAGHDGGDLGFGRDGMLYITAGDGTSDSDGWDSGQDVSNLNATLIRIDVDHPAAGQRYSAPKDNPFVGRPNTRPEIWAYGFRNPWRMCVDEKTGDIWVGNNGQDLWETAYLVHRGDNFGWSVMEGSHPFYPHRRRGPTPIVPPTIEHHHSEFRSLTGGVVYYGDKLPELNGAYIYGDYSTGKIWGARHREGKLVWHQELAATQLQIVAFCVDQRGELLVADHGGGIYRIVPKPKNVVTPKFPTRLSDTGLFTSTKDYRKDPGLIPYSVNAPGWLDGATADRYIALPGNDKISYSSSRGWGFSDGAVLVQTISLQTAPGTLEPRRRIETRVLLKQDGQWAGYSYRWNQEQTDADLVNKSGEDLELSINGRNVTRTQKWRIPSRTECMTCHSRAVGFVLGMSELQMNQPILLNWLPTNQLTLLQDMGVFTGKISENLDTLPRLVNPYDPHEDLNKRARSYLHANCSVCHVEAGGGNAKMELEFTRKPAEMNLLSARPQHDTLGLSNAMLVAPGEPDRSVLLARLLRRGNGQMPPLVTAQVDEKAVAMFRQWIAAMKPELALVREWSMTDLMPALGELDSGRSFEAGKRAFQTVGCTQCHKLNDDGGSVGPNLTGVGRRLNKHDILESILEPSKVIADEFADYHIDLKNKKTVTGHIEREDANELMLRTGSAVDELARIKKSDIIGRRKSQTSNMPAGIANVLDKTQILDLMAYLISDGNANAPVFKP